MLKLEGVKRIESLLQNEAERQFVEKHVYGNSEIEFTFNIWLDDSKKLWLNESKKLKIETLKDFIESLVKLDIDILRDGFDINRCIQDKAEENDISKDTISPVLASNIIPLLTDIKYELSQYTEEEGDYTCFDVNFILSGEQELLFRLLGIDKRFAYNTRELACIHYNNEYCYYNKF